MESYNYFGEPVDETEFYLVGASPDDIQEIPLTSLGFAPLEGEELEFSEIGY